MTTREDITNELLALTGLEKLIQQRKAELRAEAETVFTRAGQREIGVLAGDEIGNVQLCKAEPSWQVWDADAFLRWVKANRPDQIQTVESVYPAFTKQLLDSLKNGEPQIDPETGEYLVPAGIAPRSGKPSLRVTLAKSGPQTVLNALGDAAVVLGLAVPAEIEAA